MIFFNTISACAFCCATKILDKPGNQPTASIDSVRRKYIPKNCPLVSKSAEIPESVSLWNAGLTQEQSVDPTEPVRKAVILILNKVTLENFEQQSKKILDVNISSPYILSVVLQLIFRKAINEPNFTALYAQLCSNLCTSAPNFEVAGSPQSTSLILLLKLCENEFKARNRPDIDPPTARQRSLGNVRFIAELGLLGVVPEKVLHNCIVELLSGHRRSRPTLAETTGTTEWENGEESLATDIECLCLLLKIVGKFLDIPKARNLMDQYFRRLQRIQTRAAAAATSGIGLTVDHGHLKSDGFQESCRSRPPEALVLPARIRFMLEDILDLRKNGWIPRRAGQRNETTKPRYLSDIRMEVFKDSGTLVSPTPGERSSSSRDIPGSAYSQHLAAVSSVNSTESVPFISSLINNTSKGGRFTPFCHGTAESNFNEIRSWQELTRMGEELCRTYPRNSAVFGVSTGRNPVTSDPTSARLDGGHSNGNRRSFNSKSDTSTKTKNNNYGDNIACNGFNPFSYMGPIILRQDSAESGWTRGVAVPFRRLPVTTRSLISGSGSSNLPPRMLRRIAADNATCVGTVGSPDHMTQSHNPLGSENQGSQGLSTTPPMSADLRSSSFLGSASARSNNHGLLTLPQTSPSKAVELFEPAYMLQESVHVLRPGSFRSMHQTATELHSQPSSVPACRNNFGTILRPDIPSSQQSSAIHRPSNVTEHQRITACSRFSSALDDSAESSEEIVGFYPGSGRSATASDEQNKMTQRLISAFERAQCGEDLLTALRSPEFRGRLTTELLATFTLRACEEVVSFPLASLDPSELAQILCACTSFLTTDDANSKAGRTAKDLGHRLPLVPVWLHILNKLLSPNSITLKSRLAAITASLLWTGDLEVNDIAVQLKCGKHHPLFLLILQQLTRLADEASPASCPRFLGQQCPAPTSADDRRELLRIWFRATGIELKQMMPEGSQSNEKLCEILEERNLLFLMPILQISHQLNELVRNTASLLNSDSCTDVVQDDLMAERFSEYLDNYVAPEDRQSSDFVHAFMSAVYSYVYRSSVLQLSPDSSLTELMTRERSVWQRLRHVGLTAMLCGSPKRQLDTLHALQLFWVDKDKPKGFFLRCFMNLYHCDLVDENTFLAWREELNPTYPAKGDALFEVNRWLMWLENAEEEDEEERKIEAVASSLEATLDIKVLTSSSILSDSWEFHVGRLTEKSQTRPTHSLSTVLTTSTDNYQSTQSE